MTDTRVVLEHGKYTFICSDRGEISCLRFGEPWCGPEHFGPGSKALISLIHRCAVLEEVAQVGLEIEDILLDHAARKQVDSFTAQPLSEALRKAEFKPHTDWEKEDEMEEEEEMRGWSR